MPASVETTRRHARLAAMQAVQQAVANSPDIERLFHALHSALAEVLDTRGLILGLYDDVSRMVEIVRQMEAGVELPGGSFPLGDGFLSEVIRTRQPRLIRQWSQEGPRVQLQYATPTQGLPEATVTVPLLVGDRVMGVLSVQSYQPNAYDEDDLLLVQAIAGHVATSIEGLKRGDVVQAVRRASEVEAILASMTEGLLIVDAASRIVSLNPPARAMFGLGGASIILGHPLDREQWGQWPLGARSVAEALSPILDALRRGEALQDIEVEVRSGGMRALSFSSAPLFDTAGQLAGGIIVFRDVTNQRDVARLKDELLSIASHDLRTPVTIVKAQAQLMQRALQRGVATPATLAARADLIVEQTDRLARMLNLLLDLSRVEAGRLDLSPEYIDLAELVTRVVAGVQTLSTSHRLEVQAPARIEGIWDTARLEQVVQNLLTNAIKYAPDGGPITVAVEGDDETATVSVRDEGLGIPAEELPRLFERFYRVEGTRSLEGNGLGLHICQAIVSAHGGRIWATSDGPGRGSTFWFTLPRRPAEQPGT